MPKASKSIEIDVPIDFFFSVVVDFDRYEEFIPEMKSSRVDRKEGNVYVASFTLDLIKKIDYTLELTANPPDRVEWKLVSGNLMSLNSGDWKLEKLGDEKIRATYSEELKLGALVPKSITNLLVEQSLPKMLKQFKQRAESMYQQKATA